MQELTPEERFGFAFDIDQWYPKCSDFTFPTFFIPVSQKIASIICKFYEFQVQKKESSQLQQEEYEDLKVFESEIDSVLQQHFIDENDEESTIAFLRMSGRSPKDAVFGTDRIKKVLKRKLYEMKHEMNQELIISPDEIQNMEFIAYFEAQAECMKISNNRLNLCEEK